MRWKAFYSWIQLFIYINYLHKSWDYFQNSEIFYYFKILTRLLLFKFFLTIFLFCPHSWFFLNVGHKEKSYTSKLSTPEIYLLNFFSNYRGKNEEFGSSQWGIPKMNDHMQWNYYLRPLKYYLKQRFLSGSQRAEYSLQMSFVWTTQFLKYLNRLPRFQNQEISHKNLDFWLIITKQQQWIWQTGPTFPPGNNWLETRSSYLTVVETWAFWPTTVPTRLTVLV